MKVGNCEVENSQAVCRAESPDGGVDPLDNILNYEMHVRVITSKLRCAQASFSQSASARLIQSAVILSVGLAVLLLLRAALKRVYGRRREAAGASMHSPARRSPLKP